MDQWHPTRIKTFSSKGSFDNFLDKEIIYQEYMDRKNTEGFSMSNIQDYFGEREWFLVDFFNYQENHKMIEEVKNMNR